VAALQYAAAVARDSDPQLLRRATEVSAEALQPSLVAKLAQRWIGVEPSSLDANAPRRAQLWSCTASTPPPCIIEPS